MNTKQYITIIAILAMSLVMSGCEAGQLFGPTPTPIPTTGTVEGTVLQDDASAIGITLSIEADVRDGATPTPGAENESTSQETKTDANGNYVFMNLLPGDYLITLGILITNADIKCVVIESVKVEAGKQSKVDFSIPQKLNASMGLVPLPDGKTAFCLRN